MIGTITPDGNISAMKCQDYQGGMNMPVKREKRTRNQRIQLDAAVVEMWRQGDLDGVHSALKLKPWECSPAWCRSLWLHGGEPCSDKELGGCHRAKEIRDELIQRSGVVPEVEK